MKLIESDDLAAHEKSDAPAWRESYYCNFFDHDSGLHGLSWLGVRPNDEHGEALFAIFDGEETLLRHIDFKVPISKDVGDEERRTLGPLSFEPIDPWSHWKVHFDDGESKLEVDWQQTTAMCDWEWEDITNSKHFQGAGKVAVKGNIGDREVNFTGTGERDRAWGERDYGFWTYVWWLVAQFRDGTATHVFLMRDQEGNDRLHGYLHQDGETRNLASYEADVEYTPNGGPPQAGRHTITDDAGRQLVLAETNRMHFFSFSAAGPQVEDRPPEGMEKGRMFWTFHKFVREDGLEGRGMIDYVFWSGNQPPHIEANGPIRSSIYDFGLEAAGATG
jgi:hypothetical protein